MADNIRDKISEKIQDKDISNEDALNLLKLINKTKYVKDKNVKK